MSDQIPLATETLAMMVLTLISNSKAKGLLKVGYKETERALKDDTATLIVLAADVQPLNTVASLVTLAQEHNVPFIYVNTKRVIGRAAQIKRPAMAVAITGSIGPALAQRIMDVHKPVKEDEIV